MLPSNIVSSYYEIAGTGSTTLLSNAHLFSYHYSIDAQTKQGFELWCDGHKVIDVPTGSIVEASPEYTYIENCPAITIYKDGVGTVDFYLNYTTTTPQYSYLSGIGSTATTSPAVYGIDTVILLMIFSVVFFGGIFSHFTKSKKYFKI